MKEFLRLILGRFLAAGLRCNSSALPISDGLSMVIAPHADDETLGCGGLIAIRSALKKDVRVVFLTDSAGTDADAVLAQRRRAEALAALSDLGLPPSSVHFLGLPDGTLSRLDPALEAKAGAELVDLLRLHKPAEIYLPYLGGGSAEHDGAHVFCRPALAASGWTGLLYEYPVWAWWNRLRLRIQLLRRGENFRLILGDMLGIKKRALGRHATQLPVLPPSLLALCTQPEEFYFLRRT